MRRLSSTTQIVVTALGLSLWAASGNAQQQQQGPQQSHPQQKDQQEKKESGQQASPSQEKPKDAKAGPTKEELDRLQKQAAASSGGEGAKPPEPAKNFERGLGLDIRADFLHGGYSNGKLETGLLGINIQACRVKRFSFCGLGTVLMITSGADTSSGSKDIRFVVTSPMSYSADKNMAWTFYPFWDPVNDNRFGVAGGASFNWKQLFGKLKTSKPKDAEPPVQ